MKKLFLAYFIFTAHFCWAEKVAYLAVDDDGYWQVWCLDMTSYSSRKITRSDYDKTNISWYPNERSLMVNGSQGQLVKVDMDTYIEQPLEYKLIGFSDAKLSPDGNKIVFSLATSDSQDDNNIWIMDYSGKNRQKLTNMSGLQHEPRWSPSMQSVYYLSKTSSKTHDIFKYDLVSNTNTQLTFSRGYHFDISASLKDEITFSSNVNGNYDIWMLNKKNKYVQITSSKALEIEPSWSPDGNKIVYVKNSGDTSNLWIFDLKNDEHKQLTSHKKGVRRPIWNLTNDK